MICWMRKSIWTTEDLPGDEEYLDGDMDDDITILDLDDDKETMR